MGKIVKYLGRISYRGKYFFGFEKRYGVVTTCGNLEKICSAIFNTKVSIEYSYVPDFLASVNNFPLVLACDGEVRDEGDLMEKINNALPHYIVLSSLERVEEDYNLADKKLYVQYECQIVNNTNILYDENIIYIENEDLNVNSMRMAVDYLLGENDFSCFTDGMVEDTFRTIYEIDIEVIKNNIYFNIEGDAMLPNMIPMVVGELVLVGRGIRQPQDILGIIKHGRPDELLPNIPTLSENILNVDFVEFIEKEYHSCNDRWDYYVLNHDVEAKGRRYVLINKIEETIFQKLLNHIVNTSFDRDVKEVYIIDSEGKINTNIRVNNRKIYIADIEEVIKFSDVILSYGIRGTWYRIV